MVFFTKIKICEVSKQYMSLKNELSKTGNYSLVLFKIKLIFFGGSKIVVYRVQIVF